MVSKRQICGSMRKEVGFIYGPITYDECVQASACPYETIRVLKEKEIWFYDKYHPEVCPQGMANNGNSVR